MIDFYIKMMGRWNEKYFDNRNGKLVSCWKQIYKNGWLNAGKVPEAKLRLIIEDCSSDLSFMDDLTLLYFDVLLTSLK